MLGKNKIYHVDCIDGLKHMGDESVDLIIADYPFNCQDGKVDYGKFVKDTANEFLRVLKKDCVLVVINNPKNIFKFSHCFNKFELRDSIVLLRGSSIRPAWHFAFRHNICQVLIKPGDGNKINIKRKWNGTKVNHDKSFLTDVIEYRNGYICGKDLHPQAIPLDLVKTFVSLFSDKGDLVLDPFFGSGTTGLACKELRRDYVGFEFYLKYVEMGRRRITRKDINRLLD